MGNTEQELRDNWSIERRGDDAILSMTAASHDWHMLAEHILKRLTEEDVIGMDMGFTLHNFFKKYEPKKE